MSDMDKHQDPATLRPGMCACGQPTQGHNDHYCNPLHGYHAVSEASGPNLTSPSARLTNAVAQLNGLRTLNAEYIGVSGASITPKAVEGILKHTCDALDAIHEALADLYTGRLP